MKINKKHIHRIIRWFVNESSDYCFRQGERITNVVFKNGIIDITTSNSNVLTFKYAELFIYLIDFVMNSPYIQGISFNYEINTNADYPDTIKVCTLKIFSNNDDNDYSTNNINFIFNNEYMCITKVCLYLLKHDRLNNVTKDSIW